MNIRYLFFGSLLCGGFFSLYAQPGDTITWKSTEPKSEGDWSDPTQWDLGRVPEDGDIVVLPSPSGGTASYNFMTTTASGRLPSTGRFKKVEIKQAHRLRLSGWETQLVAEEVVLKANTNSSQTDCGGTISSDTVSTATSSNRVWIVADTISAGVNSVISAKGYNKGLGPCWEGVASPSGSGCHGGLGSFAPGSSGLGHVYGDLRYPKALGSGGIGSSANNSTGGGAVWLQVKTLVLDGRIGANGGSTAYNTAAGSGGSVLIECETVAGGGRISADGGGYAVYNQHYENSSAGGGGRIAVHYDAEKQKDVPCDVLIEARGGQAGDNGSAASDPLARYKNLGQSGTVYLTDDRFTKRPGVKLSGRVYYGPDETRMNSIVVDGDCDLVNCYPDLGDDAVVSVGGNLTIASTRDQGTRQNGLLITGTNATVTVGGNLSVSNAQLKVTNGGIVQVGGSVLQCASDIARTGGEIFLRAGDPIYADGLGGKLVVEGDWTVGSRSGAFVGSNPTNGTIVALSCRDFILSEDAVLSADGLGYAGQCGPGKTSGMHVGAAHGGRGAHYETGAKSGTTYGDEEVPLTPGSGGTRSTGASQDGAGGGGVVYLTTVRDMVLNGTVSADGGQKTNYTSAPSGGSVNLQCGRRLGGTTGSVTANGGRGDGLGGAGGGGRIAIYYVTRATDLGLSVAASGGSFKTETERTGMWGEDGTVFWKQAPGAGLLLIFR